MSDSRPREWDSHADWWLAEIADDPIYQLDVLPLLDKLMVGTEGISLDLGCGEGQGMRNTGGQVIGCDISMALLHQARAAGPVVRSDLPDLSWLRSGSVAAAFMVLVLEHLDNLRIFAEAARVVGYGGRLVVVMNHPAFTADGAGPIMDPADGEMLWRWGNYFEPADCAMATSAATVTFYHRPLGMILNAAAAAGWSLDELIETGFSEAAIATEPGYVGQEQIPRLLGARWTNTQGGRRRGR